MSAAIREALDAVLNAEFRLENGDRYSVLMKDANAMVGKAKSARTALEAITSEGTVKGAPLGSRHIIPHDGFTGTVIGYYERLDGKRGVVLQQDGTKVVHVYGEKWLTLVEAPIAPILSGEASPREFSPDEGLGKLQDWAVDTHSTASPILAYQTCSVIEGEQAYGVLDLVKVALTPEVETDKLLLAYEQGRRDALAEAGPVGEAVAWGYFTKAGELICTNTEEMLRKSYPAAQVGPLYRHPAASPAEEPGKVERALSERSAAEVFAPPPGVVERLTRERDMCRSAHRELMELYEVAIAKRKTAEAALAETRDRLEEQEEHTFRIVAENDKLRELADAAEELLTVSNLRGETAYLDPISDPGLWTSRRNEAWSALEKAVVARAALTGDAQEAGR